MSYKKLKMVLGGIALVAVIAIAPSGGKVNAEENSIVTDGNINIQQSIDSTSQDTDLSGENLEDEEKTEPEEKKNEEIEPMDTLGEEGDSSESSDTGDTGGGSEDKGDTSDDSEQTDTSEEEGETEGTETGEPSDVEEEKEPLYKLVKNKLYRVDDGTPFTGTGFALMEDGSYYYVVNGKWSSSVNDILKGRVDGKNGWWYVRGGQVKFTDTVAKNKNGWWSIENGKVNFS